MAHPALSLHAPQGQTQVSAEVLRTLELRARLDRGCESSEVYASVEDQSLLTLQQEWVAEADLARYVRPSRASESSSRPCVTRAGSSPRMLARQLDARLEVEGTGGTCFRVTLPVEP